MTDSWDLPGSLSDILDASLGEAPVAHIDFTVQPRDDHGHFQSPRLDLFGRPIVVDTGSAETGVVIASAGLLTFLVGVAVLLLS